MNFYYIIPVLSIFLSCTSNNPKFIRKQISNKDITIRWYYYSYITNNSPDIVEVEQSGIEREIFKAEWVILDVTLQNHNITLRLVEPSKGLVLTKKVEEEIFGYKIILDTTGKYDEIRLRPNGIKER